MDDGYLMRVRAGNGCMRAEFNRTVDNAPYTMYTRCHDEANVPLSLSCSPSSTAASRFICVTEFWVEFQRNFVASVIVFALVISFIFQVLLSSECSVDCKRAAAHSVQYNILQETLIN